MNLSMEQKIDAIYNTTVNDNKTLDFLNVIAIVIGFYNTYLNRQQIDNNTIMAELDKQDKIYFNKIIKLLENKGVKNDDE